MSGVVGRCRRGDDDAGVGVGWSRRGDDGVSGVVGRCRCGCDGVGVGVGWSSLRGHKWPSGGTVRTQRQLCRSCDFPAQGCGRSTLPWVTAPTNLATLQELRLAVGVMLNLMVPTNPFLPIILLRVTPTAKRNTYSVATPYYIYTLGRGAARLNPGL